MNYTRPKVANFRKQLALIEEKSQELDLEIYATAATKAKELHQNLTTNLTFYLMGEINLAVFHKNCAEAIELARPELEQFPAVKLILANLSFLLALMVMGTTVTRIVNSVLPEKLSTDLAFHHFNWMQNSLSIH